jgi:hypothetical protein
MKFPRTLLLATMVATLLPAAHSQPTQGRNMDRTSLITSQTFDVKIMANGVDISTRSPVQSVKYDPDGNGSRKLRDGTVISGQWRFLNAEQTQIEVKGPEGASRWVIIELNDKIYRKANIDTGVEFIHLPKS